MDEFGAWLDKMAANPLPGGVAAAALGAAMGAALVAKVAGRAPARRSVHDLARTSRDELLRLAGADEAAYRAVLEAQRHPSGNGDRRQARRPAVDVPLSVAETCRRLLDALPALDGAASPALEGAVSPGLAVDLEIGRRLLEAGAEAALLAAAENLRTWGGDLDDPAYRRRLVALGGGEGT